MDHIIEFVAENTENKEQQYERKKSTQGCSEFFLALVSELDGLCINVKCLQTGSHSDLPFVT